MAWSVHLPKRKCGFRCAPLLDLPWWASTSCGSATRRCDRRATPAQDRARRSRPRGGGMRSAIREYGLLPAEGHVYRAAETATDRMRSVGRGS